MSDKLTILLATIGRPTLGRCLRALREQHFQKGDEILLVSDNQHDACCNEFQKSELPGRHVRLLQGPHRDWGHTPRNQTMSLAQGDWLWHIDDDDIVLPGAVAEIRRLVRTDRGGLHKFSLLTSSGAIHRSTRAKPNGHCATPSLVHPVRSPYGTWGNFYGGDAYFARETIRLNPQRKLYGHEHFVYLVRPPANARLDDCYLVAQKFLNRFADYRLVPSKQSGQWKDLALCDGTAGREDFQADWHKLIDCLYADLHMLDVGAGLGKSRERMRRPASVCLQDPAPVFITSVCLRLITTESVSAIFHITPSGLRLIHVE